MADAQSLSRADLPPPRQEMPQSPAQVTSQVGSVLEPVQYLRAIAAWAVVAYHLSASLESEFGWTNHFELGAIGVDIFFVISGYIMAMIAARPGRFSPPEFFLRRFLRIAPLYWLMTLALCVLCLVFPAVLNDSDIPWSRFAFSLFFLPDFATGLTLPALAVGWTLNYEFFFYAIVAGSIAVFQDRTLIAAAVILSVCVALGSFIGDEGIAGFYTQPILMEFVLGILIWNYGDRVTGRAWFTPVWLCLVPVIFAALAISGIYSDGMRHFIWGVPAGFFVLGFIPLCAVRLNWLSKLGDWSFSTYLIHIYVIQLFVKLCANSLQHSAVLLTAGMAVVFGAIVLVSAIQFAWFERPLVATLNRYVSRILQRRTIGV